MKLFRKLFGIEDQSKLIEKKFNEMQDKVLAEVTNLKNKNASLEIEKHKLVNRVTELLTKLRDQNEADLLLEAKRIEKKILDRRRFA